MLFRDAHLFFLWQQYASIVSEPKGQQNENQVEKKKKMKKSLQTQFSEK